MSAVRGRLAALGAALLVACGGPSLPRPDEAPILAADYVEVPFAPRAAPVEVVPDRPAKNAVWTDGAWAWNGDRFRWVNGGWVVPPSGARRAPWALVRREVDGQLFFAPAVWRDATGRTMPDPVPVARARTRVPREGVAESER